MNQFGDADLRVILQGSVPKHEDLYYFFGKIDPSPNIPGHSLNKSYQQQIFKCRCLIFSEEEVIACPVLGSTLNIHIIVSRQFHSTGKLKYHLDKLNITVQEPTPVKSDVYKFCLRYTILARLAPAWNQVEKYLINGRNFLTSSAPFDAVNLDININENDMHLVLWPLRIRLPQVCPQDLHHSLTFNQLPFAMDLTSYNVSVHVLPSMNVANVVMVAGHFLNDTIFKSYKEMKRYWKNSYGYRLPESDEGMVYLKVQFGRWSDYLTYPLVCVRSHRPVFLRQHEPQMVLMKMIADLRAKMPNLCGFPFMFNTNFLYAVPIISPASQIVYPSNLAKVKPVVKKYERMKDDDDCSSATVSPPTLTEATLHLNKVTSANISTLLPTSSAKKPLFKPIFTPKIKPYSGPPASSSAYIPAFYSRNRSPSPTQNSQSLPSPTTEDLVLSDTVERKPIRPIFEKAQPLAPKNIFCSSQPEPKGLKPNQFGMFPIFNPSTSEDSCLKDQVKLPNLSTPGNYKKTRNKQQVQDVDIREMAKIKNGLSKVNTTTLVAFLRQEGVPCRVKEKKNDLVSKVLTHLQLPIPVSNVPPLFYLHVSQND